MNTSPIEQIDLSEVIFLRSLYTTPTNEDDDRTLRMKSYLSSLDLPHLDAFILIGPEHHTTRAVGAFLNLSHATANNYFKSVQSYLSKL